MLLPICLGDAMVVEFARQGVAFSENEYPSSLAPIC